MKSKKGEGKSKKDKDANDTTMNKKPGRPSVFKLPNTIMDLETIYKILCVLYEWVLISTFSSFKFPVFGGICITVIYVKMNIL